MTDSLSKRRLRLWLKLLRVTRTTEAQLREFLRVEHASTLPRFDVMAALHRADDSLTMTELSRLLLVSNGNTTTVVDRLEHDGLVSRTPSAADRRVVHVALTDAGRRRFEQLAADHEAHLDSLFSGVSTSDLDALDDLLQRLITRRTNARTPRTPTRKAASMTPATPATTATTATPAAPAAPRSDSPSSCTGVGAKTLTVGTGGQVCGGGGG